MRILAQLDVFRPTCEWRICSSRQGRRCGSTPSGPRRVIQPPTATATDTPEDSPAPPGLGSGSPRASHAPDAGRSRIRCQLALGSWTRSMQWDSASFRSSSPVFQKRTGSRNSRRVVPIKHCEGVRQGHEDRGPRRASCFVLTCDCLVRCANGASEPPVAWDTNDNTPRNNVNRRPCFYLVADSLRLRAFFGSSAKVPLNTNF